MTPEHDELLVSRFPELYKNRHAPSTETAMCFGFDVGDGWFSILYMLSAALSSLDNVPVAFQVKEKFGGLRFYYDGGDFKTCNALIEIAERAAWVTCEDCGKPGKLRKGGWLRTLCDECDEGRNQ